MNVIVPGDNTFEYRTRPQQIHFECEYCGCVFVEWLAECDIRCYPFTFISHACPCCSYPVRGIKIEIPEEEENVGMEL